MRCITDTMTREGNAALWLTVDNFWGRYAFGFFALFLALGIIVSTHAQDLEWRFSNDRITFEQWTSYFDELAHRPGAVLTEQDQYYIINLFNDPSQPALYVFTKPSHPAYPAVVIRAVTTKNGRSQIVHHGHYVGDKDKFDTWWHEFDALDKKNIDNAK